MDLRPPTSSDAEKVAKPSSPLAILNIKYLVIFAGILAIALGVGLGVGLRKSSSTTTPTTTYDYSAIAYMTNTTSSITGTATFTQNIGSGVTVKVTLAGIKNNVGKYHGIHIHANTVTSTTENLCIAAGGHFNPTGAVHGSPTNSSMLRHVGDLGNAYVAADGTVSFTLTDDATYGISLNASSSRSILSRAIILHASPDDLGMPTTSTSYTGGAGDRIVCAVISAIV